jgi:arylsulfatase A-like enzyme
MTDDHGFGDLSCHGNDRLNTPNLDRIAREGVEFTQFHVSPVCAPTRSSLMTGRYNYRTGAIDTYLGRAMMHSDEVTLPEVLAQAGYRTGIFGKWHLGDNYPMRPIDQGFREAVNHLGGGIAQPSDLPGGSSYFDPVVMHNGRIQQYKGYCTDVFTNEALRFMEENRSRPFFAYLAPNAPHTPLQVDEKYVAPFRSNGLDETTAKVYGMVANIDENVGRLLGRLNTLGLAENTIVIFMTDNGPQQRRYNAGMRGLKGTVYEGGIRVPFFIRWPKVLKPGRKVDRLAAHIDVLPTVLDACGVPRMSGIPLDGRSLMPLLRDEKTHWPDRTISVQWHRGDEPEMYRACMTRNQRWKLVDGKELYDLQSDPEEKEDVSSRYPEIAARLRKSYEEWFRDVSSTRGYQPPRIYLGTKFENPVTLSRQDWRGPKAGWNADSLGYWEVDVREAGAYDITFRFAARPSPGTARFRLGALSFDSEKPLAAGSTWCEFRKVALPRGHGRLEAILSFGGAEAGANYVDVKRVE